MKIKNGAEYMESLRKINPVIYYKGEKIKDVTRHPATAPHVRSAAMTYALAADEEYRDLATATSHLTGRTISRFTHVHQSVEDLIKKIIYFKSQATETFSVLFSCCFTKKTAVFHLEKYIFLGGKNEKEAKELLRQLKR